MNEEFVSRIVHLAKKYPERKVLVFGTKASNFPDALVKNERFLFWMNERPAWEGNQSIGIVLMTRFVKHSEIARLKSKLGRQAQIYENIGTGRIRDILRQIEREPVKVEKVEAEKMATTWEVLRFVEQHANLAAAQERGMAIQEARRLEKLATSMGKSFKLNTLRINIGKLKARLPAGHGSGNGKALPALEELPAPPLQPIPHQMPPPVIQDMKVFTHPDQILESDEVMLAQAVGRIQDRMKAVRDVKAAVLMALEAVNKILGEK